MSRRNSRKWSVSVRDREGDGVEKIKSSIEEFLKGGEGEEGVRGYLRKATEDDALLLRFLKGRKFRPKHAYETLKRYAEVRFHVYPDMFLAECPKEAGDLMDEHAIGLLKARDKKGRRICYFDANKWNTEKYNLELLTKMAVHFAEQLMLDEDCMTNGCIFIQECSGMSGRHVQEYTLHNMLRFMDIFWYGCPLRPKALYFVNVPFILTFIYGIVKPLLPKKLKERFYISSSAKKFHGLHQHFPPDILPKCLGGKLEAEDANDLEIMNLFR